MSKFEAPPVKKTDLKTVLQETKYHELKDKFKELGMEEVWKGGKKKEELIKSALEKFNELKNKVDSVDKETQEDLEQMNEQVEDNNITIETEEKEITPDVNIVVKEQIAPKEDDSFKAKYTKEDGTLDLIALERALKIITSNLRSNQQVKNKRASLIERKNKVLALIEQAK